MRLFDTLRTRAMAFGAMTVSGVLVASQAHAHHQMGGATPETFTQGLLSGFGHPIIGLDHLAFVIGVGLLAAVAGFGFALPFLFVVAMCGGLALHLLSVTIPAPELLIGASVLLVGLAVALRTQRKGTWIEGGLFALAGVLHGYAFAESIIGAEQSPLVAYIVGLIAIQSAIAIAAYGVGRLLISKRLVLPAASVRFAGLAIALVGTYFVASASGFIA